MGKMVDDKDRIFIRKTLLQQQILLFRRVCQSHMIFPVAMALHRAVQADKTERMRQFRQCSEILIAESARIMGIEHRFILLRDMIKKAAFILRMRRPQCRDRVSAGAHGPVGHDAVKTEPLTFSPKRTAGCQNLPLDRVVSIHLHLPRIGMRKRFPKKFKILRIAMIAVTVRKEKRPDAVKLQPVIQGMEIIIRRQIQQQIIVDQRLGTGPDVLPAELTGLPAQLTVTEHPRPCFPGSGTIISDLHLFILP